MKKPFALFILLILVALVSSACVVNVEIPTAETAPVVETATLEPATTTPEVFIALTQAVPGPVDPTPVPPTAAPLITTYAPLSLVVPASVASGASGLDLPRVDSEDAAWWQKDPGHLQVSLDDYYVLQGKAFPAQINVYPAMSYVELLPAAFESIHRLDNLLYGTASLTPAELPALPYAGSAQLFAARMERIDFQNGSGVRFLTEYGQHASSANNQELFYQFQGLTRDGEYYIVATFPVSSPVLAETSDAGAPLPAGGIPYPYMADPGADMTAYYAAVTDLLNAQPAEAFTPNLDQLDALVQSMEIVP